MDTLTRNQWIGITVAVVVIILGGWWIFAHRASSKVTGGLWNTGTSTSNQQATSTDFATGTHGPSVVANGEAVSIVDQNAGSSVAIASVTLSQPGWVAIKDAKGWVLGAAWFPAGTLTNVKVPLLRSSVSGQRYQVLVYVDNGDKKFDLHKETLVTNADGSVTGSMFNAK